MTAIDAAGGVVWRPGADGVEVVLVHRPLRDDWTLPIGRLQPGETVEECALREVTEETGYRCELGTFLTTLEVDAEDGAHRFHLFAMTPVDGGFVPNEETDRIEWLPAALASKRATYANVRDLLASFQPTSAAGRLDDPYVLLVTGHPGAGKSTLGPRLAEELGAVCISRDEIHQIVFDGWEPEHPGTPQHYELTVKGSTFSEGKVNWDLFLWMIETVSRRAPVVAESPFNSAMVRERFLERAERWAVRVAEVALVGDAAVLLQRVRARASAPGAHVIKSKFTVEGAERLLEHPYVPVLGSDRVVVVDTTDLSAVDVPAVARAARDLLRR